MRTFVMVVAAWFLVGAAWAQKSEQGSQPQKSTPAVATQTYKGTLVDASCAGNTTQKTTPANPSKDKSTTTSGTADRVQNCAVSANTKEFALQTNDGRVLRFDAVGNQRAEDNLKNEKKWISKAAGGKTISAKVAGTLDGDNLTVVTIN
ncbi:MAG TPA: hypothetical protein VLY24_29750 [Bryobacteraceae bacterium]|nr:hypothetical protein [Bryobacteraceae bacterium]